MFVSLSMKKMAKKKEEKFNAGRTLCGHLLFKNLSPWWAHFRNLILPGNNCSSGKTATKGKSFCIPIHGIQKKPTMNKGV